MAESAHYLYGQDHLQHSYSDTYYDSALPQSSSLSMAAYYQPEQSQRKRPKYTRSKTGCMTCRQKKVKCDEEKPDCARCRAGGRDCVWPDGGTTRKRTTRRDTRASHSHSPSIDMTQAPTGGSASPSIASTPPSRLKAEPVDFPLPQATPHSVSTGLRYTTEVDHYKSHIVPDDREYTESRQSPSAAAPIANTLQYHVREHTSTSQSYSQATPSEHYAQSVSYTHNQTPLYQYPEAHLIKPENDEGWQAAMSQHVDPIHPFAFPTMQAYYTASREFTLPVAAQAPHGHLAYPYMKYH